MSKQYTAKVTQLSPRPRSKRLREQGIGGTTGSTVVVSNAGGGVSVTGSSHTHENKPYLDQITTDKDNYLYLTQLGESADPDTGENTAEYTTTKVKSGYADKAATAHDLDPDSPVRDQFLSKLKDDRTAHKIASDIGFEVGRYLAGVSGGMLGMDAETGESFAEVFKLYVRGKAFFETLTIIEAATLAGRHYITPGGSIKCSKVEEVTDSSGAVTAYRCWFLSEQDGDKTETKIIPGDQAISEMFNAKTGTANKVSNHRYWRLVTAVDNAAETEPSGNVYGYIDLSATDCEADSDIPKAGDVIEQFGNRDDATRQAAMMFDTVGPDAPSLKMLTGIDSYTLEGKDVISQGYDPVKGHAYFNCFGDVYVGAPDGSTYVKYDQDTRKTILKADLEVQSTIGGQTLSDYFTALIPELKQEDIEGFVNAIVNPLIAGVQNQLDGVIETWFHNGAPSLTSYPASDWVSDADREKHLGDLYFDNDTGLGYRFSKDDSGNYYWNDKVDSATAKALAAASKAQDTADSKRRIFTSQPVPPYEEGDMWVNATFPTDTTPETHDPSSGKYCDDILRCFTSKGAGEAFSISDWGLSSNYTDDTLARAAQQAAVAAQQAANAAQDSVSDLNTYVDGAFKDGIITQTEATAIAGYINTVNSAKAEITATYNKLKDNAYLPPAGKNQLTTAYNNVDTAITSLIGAINSAIADGKITEAEKTAVDNAFAAFNTRNAAFRSAVETANEAIQKVIKSAADAAQQAADNAAAAAQEARDRLDAWAEDGVISPVEKQEISDEIARIKGDYSHIHTECDRYGLTGSEATDYYSAYGAYLNLLEGILASTEDCVPIPVDFAGRQENYYTKRTAALSAIAAAAKKYADDAAEKAVAGYKYLKQAIGDVSKTIGGVFLTSLIRVGEHNTDLSTQTTWGGLNGVYTAPYDISYWAGGDCLDLFKPDGITRKTQAELGGAGARPAQALFRMDGSGYLLGGAFQFRPDRTAIFGTGESAITMADGHLTLGNGISINIGGEAKGLGDSIASLTTLLTSISNMFDPVLVGSDGNVTDKGWEKISEANAIRANKAFFTVDWLSGYGVGANAGAGGSGGSVEMLKAWADYSTSDADVKALSAGLGYDLHTRVNALASRNYLDALTLAVTGSGNAVTDVSLSTDHKTLTVNKGGNYLWMQDDHDFDPSVMDGYYAGMTTHSGIGGDWWHILSMNWGTGRNNVGKTWVSQLALPTQQRNGVYYRSGASASAYSPWVRLLDEGNYASILGGAYQPKGDYVTIGTAQTITGVKEFHGENRFVGPGLSYSDPWPTIGCAMKVAGKIGVTDSIKAASFIRSGGTSSQFLMADGSTVAKKSLSAVDNSGWTNFATDDMLVPTMAFIAYWNGRHNANNSNLQYCDRGRFGDIVTHSHSEYVTALGTSGNYLTWTKNGAVNNITVPYASASGWLNPNTSLTYGVNGLQYFNIEGTQGNNKSNCTPTSGWYHILRFNHANAQGYLLDIAAPLNDLGGIYWRQVRTGAFYGWFKLLDSNNFNSVIGSNLTAYVKKAGDTMTGKLTINANSQLAVFNSTNANTTHTTWSANGNRKVSCGWFNGFAFLSCEPNYTGATSDKFYRLGITDDGVPQFWTNRDAAKYDLLHAGNYSSILDGRYYTESEVNTLFSLYYNKSESDDRFVNTAGDTMTGALKVPSIELTTISGIKFTDNILGGGGDVAKMYITGTGEAQQLTFEVQNDADDIINFITPANNGLKKNGNTVWHAGNDGSGSGLDADLLDGYHEGSFFRSYMGQIDCENDYSQLPANRSGAYWTVHSGWTGAAVVFFSGHSNSTMAFLRRGGANRVPEILLTCDSDSSRWTNVGTILTTTQGNAVSATKLQTARTIWGQRFDGSGNVSGSISDTDVISSRDGVWLDLKGYHGVALYGGGNLGMVMTSSGNVGIGINPPAYKLDVNGTMAVRGSFLYNSGDASMKIYRLTNSTSPSGYGVETVAIQTGFDGQDPQTWATQLSYPERVILSLQPRGGRVAIGKDNAAYPLDVNGDAIVRGWLRTTGAAGWYSETYGGGWYMSDSTWIRTHNGKSIYSGAGTIRTDGQLQVGANGDKFLVDSAGKVKAAGEVISTSANAFRMVYGDHGSFWRNDGRYTWLLLTASGDQYGGFNTLRPIMVDNVYGGVTLGGNTLVVGHNAYVGVKTTSPTCPLDVNGDTRIRGKLRMDDGTNYGGKINFGDGDQVYLWESSDDCLDIYAAGMLSLMSDETVAVESEDFYVKAGGKYAIYADYNARVGINTSSPAYPLDVAGNARVQNILYVTKIVIGNLITIEADAAKKALKVTGGGIYSDSYITGYKNS